VRINASTKIISETNVPDFPYWIMINVLGQKTGSRILEAKNDSKTGIRVAVKRSEKNEKYDTG
jgi:hypothetical protein